MPDHTVFAGIPGIDISSVNGAVDADKLAVYAAEQGPNFFCYARASIGTHADNAFPTTWRDLRFTQIVQGPYHAAHPAPAEGDAVREAETFLRALDRMGLTYESSDMAPALDIEVNPHGLKPSVLLTWCLTWLRFVEDRTFRRPIVYTGRWFADPTFAGTPVGGELAGYKLWLSAYVHDPERRVPLIWYPDDVPLPHPEAGITARPAEEWVRLGKAVLIHQVSGGPDPKQAPPGVPLLRVPGIQTVVDRNRFKGDDTAFRAWVIGSNLRRSVVANEALVPGGSTAATGIGEADRAENLVSDGGEGERHGGTWRGEMMQTEDLVSNEGGGERHG